MAKKAKRRGRPPGSKNKKSLGKSVTTMEVAQLRAHIDNLQGMLATKVNEQRSYFEAQLAQRWLCVEEGVSSGKGSRARRW